MITSIEQANSEEFCIRGVSLKNLKTFPDDRGFFRELIRSSDDFFKDGFAQWSHSKMGLNTVKAWHYHHLQIDWWYLAIGLAEVVLFDNRKESPTYRRKMQFKLGEAELDKQVLTAVVRIPQGVLHGLKVLSDTAHLFYITSRTYNPEDEGRFPFDSSIVEHDWGDASELIVAANDRREFAPTNPRTALA